MNPGLRERLRGDFRRAAGAAFIGCGVASVIEGGLALALAPYPVRAVAAVEFLALDVTLFALAALFVVPLAGLGAVCIRLLWSAFEPAEAAGWSGLAAPRAAEPAGVEEPPRVERALPWLWAVPVIALVAGGASWLASYRLLTFKEPRFVAAAIAATHLLLVPLALAGFVALGVLFRRAAHALARRLGSWNPLGRTDAALVLGALLTLLAGLGLVLLVRKVPPLAQVFPGRLLLTGVALIAGTLVGARLVARRGRLFAAERQRGRRQMVAVVGSLLALAAPSLVVFGADQEAKILATTSGTALEKLAGLVRTLHDLDGDGYGNLLGENDCAPLDAKIHPGARDLPDNGVDENCNGRDLGRGPSSWKTGEQLPIPAPFARSDWNILLVTIDTVRYDHTSLAGYARDTTPNLKKLADRSTTFTFANAPSAGTMASVPAILISRFFHSGIALGPERRPNPPEVLPENTTLAELLKTRGYKTGAIVSHEYFEKWGLEQGFDEFDNELGKKPNPFGVTSQDITDRAEAFIARQRGARWFLWAHYIDPHGRYVPHPGDRQFGPTEEDLYDGELAYTDKYLGRLLDYLDRSGVAGRTIVIVTSDHGDGFNEHGFINHGQKLYFELLHVPLVIHIPEVEPRVVDGPVSPMDIFPTVAALAGVTATPAVEGESLVPQIFYERDASARVVFAETNYPEPLRAVITADYKAIVNLKQNTWELFHHPKDPREQNNVWTHAGHATGRARMKGLLDEWLDRVYYSRDDASQAQRVRREYLLLEPPTPKFTADALFAGSVRLLGWEPTRERFEPGQPVEVVAYFRCDAAATASYRIEAEAIGLPSAGAVPARLSVKQDRVPGDGTFPTDRWRVGEIVKQTFTLRVPPSWRASRIELGIRLLDEKRQPVPVVGKSAAADGKQALVGELPVMRAAPGALPTPGPVPVKGQPLPGVLPGLRRPTLLAPRPGSVPTPGPTPGPTPVPAPAPRAP